MANRIVQNPPCFKEADTLSSLLKHGGDSGEGRDVIVRGEFELISLFREVCRPDLLRFAQSVRIHQSDACDSFESVFEISSFRLVWFQLIESVLKISLFRLFGSN